jgi:hypothetical protein
VKSLRILIASVAVVSCLGSAHAQQAPAQPQSGGPDSNYAMGPWMMGPHGMMGYGNMGPWMMGGGQGASTCTAMAGHIDGRLAYIKAELKITDAQESLWKSYAGAAREHAQAMTAHCSKMMAQRGTSNLSLTDRLDQHEQFMAAQLEALRTMNKALKPLYAALDATQKRAADELFWGPMGMM